MHIANCSMDKGLFKEVYVELKPIKKNATQHARGFTFLDTACAILILGFLAAVGFPALNAAREDYRLSGAAEEIVTALEYARALASNSGRQTRVTVDSTADTILVEQFAITANLLGSETTLPKTDVEGGAYEPMEIPMNRGIDYTISFLDEMRFKGVDITSSTFGAGDFVIFNSLGIPSDGGTVTLNLGSRQMVITVDSISGSVTTGV
jgi:hypothetical protein